MGRHRPCTHASPYATAGTRSGWLGRLAPRGPPCTPRITARSSARSPRPRAAPCARLRLRRHRPTATAAAAEPAPPPPRDQRRRGPAERRRHGDRAGPGGAVGVAFLPGRRRAGHRARHAGASCRSGRSRDPTGLRSPRCRRSTRPTAGRGRPARHRGVARLRDRQDPLHLLHDRVRQPDRAAEARRRSRADRHRHPGRPASTTAAGCTSGRTASSTPPPATPASAALRAGPRQPRRQDPADDPGRQARPGNPFPNSLVWTLRPPQRAGLRLGPASSACTPPSSARTPGTRST